MSDMAVTAVAKLDAERVRADFPYLEELQNGLPVAFLDSAASAQKPRQVLEAMTELYSHSYANVHRGVYRLAERATDAYEGARLKVAAFVNAPSEREVIFTRQATEALNLVAYAWGSTTSAPATSSSSASSSTTRTSSPGSTSRAAPAPSSGRSRSTTTASCSSTRSTGSPRRVGSRSSRPGSSRTRWARSIRSRS